MKVRVSLLLPFLFTSVWANEDKIPGAPKWNYQVQSVVSGYIFDSIPEANTAGCAKAREILRAHFDGARGSNSGNYVTQCPIGTTPSPGGFDNTLHITTFMRHYYGYDADTGNSYAYDDEDAFKLTARQICADLTFPHYRKTGEGLYDYECWRCGANDRYAKQPSFAADGTARWYENEKCPEEFKPQNSCQAGGLGKYLTKNPIACRTGEKLKAETDYSGPAGLSFTRHYSSMPQLGGALSPLPQWFTADDITFRFVKKAAHGQLVELRFGDGGRLLFAGGGTATILYSSTDAHGSLASSNGRWTWTNPKGEKLSFGAGGKVATKTLKNGKVFAYSWQDDGAGNYRLTGVAEPFGRRIQVEYNSQGQMSAVVDPAGQRYRYSYDSNGNLSAVVFPDETLGNDSDNPIKTYLYEDARFPHHLTGIVDENGERYSQYGYDEQGRAILSELGNHAEKVTMEYLETGNSLVQRHQSADSFRETLLVLGHRQGVDQVLREEDFPCVDCVTGTVVNEYNSYGWLIKTTDRNGVVTTYVRDSSGRETSRTEAFGTPKQRTITTSWSSINGQPSSINDGVRTLSHTYNYYTGQLAQSSERENASGITRTVSYTYTAGGQLATVDGPHTDVSDITRYTYDTQGNLLTVTNALNHITTLSHYDAHGKPGQITDTNGLVTTLTYTPRGWLKTRTVGGLTTTFDYDKVGQLIKVTMPDASFIAYEYDAAHRLTAISNTLGERIEYTLDYAGNRIKEEVKAADGSVVLRRSKVFNALNQLLQELNAANQVVASYAYDANGNLTGTTRYTENDNHSSSYGYDALNRLSKITDALNGVTDFAYDAQDQLTQVTDPKRLSTAYGVDGLGQLKQTTSPDTGVATQTYDSAGNVKTSTNARGHTTTYTYDALNRVGKIVYHDGVQVVFGYDEVAGGNFGIGRLTSITDSSGSTTYRYDQHGRLLRKTQMFSFTPTGTALVTAYAYDSYGRLASQTTPSGAVIGYRYNSAGQVEALSINGHDELYSLRYQPFGGVQSWRWRDGTLHSRSYDLDGRLASYPLGNQSVVLSYDRAGRLIQQSGALAKQFDYDRLDRLTGTISLINQLFGYDANGNRESLTQDGALSDYDNASNGNRILGISGSDNRVYQYDAAGNTLSDGLRTYEYNTANRLSRISKGSVVVDNHYNGLGQRVRKLVSGSESRDVRYVYDEAGQTIGEYNADGTLLNEVVYLGDMPVLLIRPSGVFNIQADHLNTPRAVLTSAQVMVWKWDSTPFGETLANEDVDGNGVALPFNWRFPGQLFDAETGLHYNYFRTYDPNTGRYIESDPIGLAGGENTYSYVGAYVTGLIDPFGLHSTDAHNRLIDYGFPDLGERERQWMYRGSRRADEYFLGYQDPEYAFMHAMSSDVLSAYESCMKLNEFVKNGVARYHGYLAAAERMRAVGNRGMAGIYTRDAYDTLGFALHPVMDSTSPVHRGFIRWRFRDFIKHGNFPFTEEDLSTLEKSPELMKEAADLMKKAIDGSFEIDCGCYK